MTFSIFTEGPAISVYDGRVRVGRFVAYDVERWVFIPASNWTDLEDKALAFVEQCGGGMFQSGYYPCPDNLLEQATWSTIWQQMPENVWERFEGHAYLRVEPADSGPDAVVRRWRWVVSSAGGMKQSGEERTEKQAMDAADRAAQRYHRRSR
jgi:hypothetical protein